MKIFQKGIIAANMKNYLGLEYDIFYFDGVVPTSEAELPFADLSKWYDIQSQSLFSEFCTIVREGEDDATVKFLNDVAHKRCDGHRLLDGKYEVSISSMTASDEEPLFSHSAINAMSLGNKKAVFFGTRYCSGEEFNVTLSKAIDCSKLIFDTGSLPSHHFVSCGVDVWDGTVWQEIASVPNYSAYNTENLSFENSLGIVSDIYRIRITGISGNNSGSMLPTLRFLTDVEPVQGPVVIPTWAVIMPRKDTSNSRYGKTPIIWLEVGGPNAGKPLSLQKDTFEPFDFPVLVNLKLTANSVGAIL